MLNEIITIDFQYLKTTFVGLQGTYQLTETKTNDDHSLWQAKYSVDTFKLLETGEYKDIERYKLYDMAESGLIK